MRGSIPYLADVHLAIRTRWALCVELTRKERIVADATSEGRGAALVLDLRGLIAASYIAGDKELTAEKRHASTVIRTAVNEILERAAALVEASPTPLDPTVLAAAIRALKEKALETKP
jgi:hypothetical protein